MRESIFFSLERREMNESVNKGMDRETLELCDARCVTASFCGVCLWDVGLDFFKYCVLVLTV